MFYDYYKKTNSDVLIAVNGNRHDVINLEDDDWENA